MKKCVKCQNDLPDSAVHCVFCGAKQPANAPSAGPNKTMMGGPGMVQELLAQAKDSAPKPVQDPGSSPVNVPQATQDDRSGPVGPPPGTASPAAKTMFAAGNPSGGPPPQAGGPPPGGPPPGGPPPGGPPPGGPPQQAGGIGPTIAPSGMGGPPQGGMGGPPPGGMGGPPQGGMGGPPQGGMGGPPPGMAPPPGGPPPGHDPTNPPPGSSPPGMGGPTRPPVGPAPGMPGGPMGGSMAGPVGKGKIGDDRPETEQVKPLPPPKPPYLASESAKRMSNPVEPWAESIKTLMLVFGVLLVACFVAPWAVTDGGTVFSWTALSGGGPAYQKVVVLMLAGTGVLAVVLGALPLGVSARGFACALLGLGPFVYIGVGQGFVWQTLVGTIGMALLVSGLLLRSQYTGAVLSRIFVTLGAILVLLAVFVPFTFVDMFKLIGAAPGAGKLAAIGAVVPYVVAILALIAWLPGPGKAMSGMFAWLLIIWPLLLGIMKLLSSGDIGPALKGGLAEYIYIPLATTAWTAMAGYGIATMFGKKLEQP